VRSLEVLKNEGWRVLINWIQPTIGVVQCLL